MTIDADEIDDSEIEKNKLWAHRALAWRGRVAALELAGDVDGVVRVHTRRAVARRLGGDGCEDDAEIRELADRRVQDLLLALAGLR